MRISDVAIIGGGLSGTLQAIGLVRHEGPRAVLIERTPRLARGVAYSAAHPSHLLNTRARRMSVWPDDPDHFARWLASRAGGGPADFVPRTVFGDYLAEQLDAAAAQAPDRLAIMRGAAVDIERGDRLTIRLADGGAVACDVAILALGNLPPAAPEGLDPALLGPDLYAGDPWSGRLADGLADDDHVLLLGAGLTIVDAAQLLDARGFAGRITALSRRGLVPRRHESGDKALPARERPRGGLSALLAGVRADADRLGWRQAIDRLRPVTQAMWLAASADERARFLRHLRPWWDVHRHRLAPAVADALDRLRASGRLTVCAGRPLAFEPGAGAVTVAWSPRGTSRVERTTVRRVVNCTGPRTDLARSEEPLLQRLIALGIATPDPLGLGLAVDSQARLIGRDGRPDPRFRALGPMTRGAFWEISAVSDIRDQSWALARRLSAAHWVEGEGL